MKCPVCNVDLLMSERQGIEIDYCPQCRGVWLDRGELDKIIERASAYSTVQAQSPHQAQSPRSVPASAPSEPAPSHPSSSQQIPPQAVQAAKVLSSVIGSAAGAKKTSRPSGKGKKNDFLGSLFDL